MTYGFDLLLFRTLLDKVATLLKFPNSPKIDKILPPLHLTSRTIKSERMKKERADQITAQQNKKPGKPIVVVSWLKQTWNVFVWRICSAHCFKLMYYKPGSERCAINFLEQKKMLLKNSWILTLVYFLLKSLTKHRISCFKVLLSIRKIVWWIFKII